MHAQGYRSDEVEESHRQAIALARKQRSPSMELRARLSQLKRREGGSARDKDALSKLWRRFEEGLDTPDLQQARALLSRRAPPQA